jgi:hypothetical protein
MAAAITPQAISVPAKPHSHSRGGMSRKFIPKMPVTKVSGMNTAENTASTCMTTMVRLPIMDR